jgi:hypothetical protein
MMLVQPSKSHPVTMPTVTANSSARHELEAMVQ